MRTCSSRSLEGLAKDRKVDSTCGRSGSVLVPFASLSRGTLSCRPLARETRERRLRLSLSVLLITYSANSASPAGSPGPPQRSHQRSLLISRRRVSFRQFDACFVKSRTGAAHGSDYNRTRSLVILSISSASSNVGCCSRRLLVRSAGSLSSRDSYICFIGQITRLSRTKHVRTLLKRCRGDIVTSVSLKCDAGPRLKNALGMEISTMYSRARS